MTLSELKSIRGRLTTNTELARVVDQINLLIEQMEGNNILIEDGVNAITPYLLTPDQILNNALKI